MLIHAMDILAPVQLEPLGWQEIVLVALLLLAIAGSQLKETLRLALEMRGSQRGDL